MHLIYVSFLYLVYFNVVYSETSVSKNLIFVYDVINPGIDYVTFVKGVAEIHDKLLKSQQLFNNLLIVFPFQTSVETTTFDSYEQPIEEYLLQNRSQIEAEKTNGEKSRVMAGLWAGLYNGAPNSMIYVVTNAKPEDKSLMYAVLCEIDNKMIQVGFIIQQDYPEDAISQDYQEISLRSNGLILNMHQNSQIMTFLPNLLTSLTHKVTLMVLENMPETFHTVLVDDYLDEITIVAWTTGGGGQYITSYYNHSEDSWQENLQSQRTRSLCALKTKIDSFTDIPIGRLFINVDTNHHLYGIRVFGTSGFNFDYRFSTNEHGHRCDEFGRSCFCNCTNDRSKSIQSMLRRPMMNTQNYIHIRPTNEEYDAVFESCSIIAVDNSFVREIPLQRGTSEWHEDSYYGTFVPGPEAFYLKVTALINGKPVQRMSSFAISPFRQPSSSESEKNGTSVIFSAEYTNTNYYGSGRPKRQIIKFPR